MRTTVAIAFLAFQVMIAAQVQAQTPAQVRAEMPYAASDMTVGAGMSGVQPTVSTVAFAPVACTDPGCTEPGWAADGGKTGCRCRGCSHQAIWAKAEALLWWGKGRRVPPLVTNGPLAAGTLNYFGGDKLGQELQNGGRLGFGKWIDNDTSLGITFTALDENPHSFSATTATLPVIAQPFINVLNGFAEDSVLVSSPGVTSGFISAREQLDFIAAESFLRVRAYETSGYALDFLTGYNFSRIDNSIHVHANSTVINRPPAAVGSNINTVDVFDTENQFHGGMLGIASSVHRGCWTFKTTIKFSLGNMRQRLYVNGSTTVVPTVGAPVTDRGGVYALPSNMGIFKQDTWAYSPEVNFSLSYALRENIKVGLGYNLIWWSDVIMAGDQIDRNLNLSQTGGNPLIGPSFPAVNLRETDFWLQGATASFSWNY